MPLSDALGPVHQFMFTGSHADHAVINEAAAVSVPAELPFGVGAAIGCGISTGIVPALRSTTASEPGSLIVVVGCGIVGLSVVAGPAWQVRGGSWPWIARPTAWSERDGLGADLVIDASREEPIGAIQALTAGRGADHVFEAAGNAAAMRTAFELVRPGGELTLLGKLAMGDDLSIRFGSLMGNKTVQRLAYGGARPERDFPAIARLYLEGRLPLDLLVDREVALADVEATFGDVERGAVIRAVVRFD